MKLKFLCIIFLVTMFSCVTNLENSHDNEITTPEIIDKTEEIDIKPTEEEIRNKEIANLLSSMTIEEKIGQLFIFQIRGELEVTKNLKSFLEKYKPGGVILFSNNILNNDQVLKLNRDLININSIPMFISVDEEGGIVSRLGKEKNVDVIHLPPALTIGNTNKPILAYNSGKILGMELTSLGFNMDMAPVADVNTNPNNPVIGNRTYSADQNVAAEMVVNVIKGMQEENLIPVIKHFPGHGDTTTDSHLGQVISPHIKERLEQIEFVPFKKGIENGVDAIMTAHMIMPGISSNPLPATLNPEIIGILRNELGFNGVILTDALDMGAIINNFTSSEAAKLAIKADVDILLIPYNQEEAFNSILESVISNEISEERIDESVTRILKLKQKSGILHGNINNSNISDIINSEIHKNLVESIQKR